MMATPNIVVPFTDAIVRHLSGGTSTWQRSSTFIADKKILDHMRTVQADGCRQLRLSLLIIFF